MPRVLQSGSSATMNGVAISAEGTLTRLIHVGCISRPQFDVTYLLLASSNQISAQPSVSSLLPNQELHLNISPMNITNADYQPNNCLFQYLITTALDRLILTDTYLSTKEHLQLRSPTRTYIIAPRNGNTHLHNGS